ncbi:MAG: hypothetical protein VX664_07355 [Chloroflexota bacterium]|nr:hypothetical protein [Chloroflexota bacterium]
MFFVFLFIGRLGCQFRRFRRGSYAVGRVVFSIFDRILRSNFHALVTQTVGRLIKCLFGHSVRVDRRGHPAIKDHLSDDLRYLFAGGTNMQCAGDVPFDHLRAVAQHN